MKKSWLILVKIDAKGTFTWCFDCGAYMRRELHKGVRSESARYEHCN